MLTNNHTNCLKNLENDITYFLDMCTEEDRNLYVCEPKDKKIEVFARFICLGLAFNMNGVILNTFAQYEQIDDIKNILAYMDTLSYELIENWIEDFLEKTVNPVLKMCAQSIWEEKKIHFNDHKFEISKLFYCSN